MFTVENHPFRGKTKEDCDILRRMSTSKRGKRSGPLSIETREKISQANKRRFLDPEARREHSERMLRSYQEHPEFKERNYNGKPGVPRLETGQALRKYFANPNNRKKLSDATKAYYEKLWADGGHGPGWKGGISYEEYPREFCVALKADIRARDRYCCQMCGGLQKDCRESLHVHHIDYNKKNLDPSNLISLCRSCHTKTSNHREFYEQYFKEVIL